MNFETSDTSKQLSFYTLSLVRKQNNCSRIFRHFLVTPNTVEPLLYDHLQIKPDNWTTKHLIHIIAILFQN